MIFIYTGEKNSFDKRGVKKQNFFCQGGVNRVSGRRGDSDFALQEGGNGTLPPPHAHVCLYHRTEIDKGHRESISMMHFTSSAGWPGAHGARDWSSGAPSERQEKSPPGSDLSRPIHEISLNSRVLRNGEPRSI